MIDSADNLNPPEEPNAGGIGGLPVVDERTAGQDLRLLQQAVYNDWPIPSETKQLIHDRMKEIVEHWPDPRVTVSAAKVLVSADSNNLKARAIDKSNQPANQTNIQINGSPVQIYLPANSR